MIYSGEVAFSAPDNNRYDYNAMIKYTFIARIFVTFEG